jgi:FecR protein
VTSHRLSHAIWLVGLLALSAVPVANAMPAPDGAARTLTVDAAPSASIRLAQAQTPPPAAPQTPTPAAAAPADQADSSNEPIGNVASLTGVATVTRNQSPVTLKLKDDIYLNDVVQTQASSSLGITFNDATTFHLSANASITIDTYVYADGGQNNAGVFDITKGTVAFVAAAVARTGNMQITTPTATLGIRGTTGLVEVPEGAVSTSNNVNIKLYPDQDGHVGRIEINDRQGGRLGALTQGASGFAIRPGTGGARFAAVPLSISPQQQLRDQGFVRQVHATQSVGRQIVTEQRAIRRANPPANNRNNTRPGQPGQNRPGQPQPGTPRPGQNTPANTTRPGQNTPVNPARPGQNTPANPPRPGQNAPAVTPRPGQNAPATTTQPGQNAPVNPARPGTPQPNVQPHPPGAPPLPHGQPILRPQPGQPHVIPGVQRPGVQNRPVAPPRRPRPPPPRDRRQDH